MWFMWTSPENPSEWNWNEPMDGRLLAMADDVKSRRRYHSPLRAEQADGTRRRVLAAARDLFLARGYAGTTVNAVAEAAGVSPDTIYVSLGGKQGLLEGVLSLARFDPEDPVQRDQQQRRDETRALTDPHQRLRKLVELSCQTLARISPVHAVLRGAADGHPFAADLYTRTLGLRLQLQARNLHTYLGASLRPGLTVRQAAERYSALLSPELYHLLTVERRWSTRRYASWVADLLDHDLLG
jgi:AcrR family transcriptional regulator